MNVTYDRPERRARRRSYASQHEIGRIIKAAKKSGIVVAAIEVCPEGTVRLFEEGINSSASQSEFERWQDDL